MCLGEFLKGGHACTLRGPGPQPCLLNASSRCQPECAQETPDRLDLSPWSCSTACGMLPAPWGICSLKSDWRVARSRRPLRNMPSSSKWSWPSFLSPVPEDLLFLHLFTKPVLSLDLYHSCWCEIPSLCLSLHLPCYYLDWFFSICFLTIQGFLFFPSSLGTADVLWLYC